MAVMTIPERLYEKLRKVAEDQGLSVEGYVLSLVADLVDPESRAESYWHASEELLREAEEELAKGDLKQASEKIWGAASLAVKAVAYSKEGKRLSSHGELWEYVRNLIDETGDEELGGLWRTAISMHVNFYEGWAPRKEIEDALRDVKEFTEKLRKLS